ncbi:MAG: PIN domain-containing protein [Candidatus Rokubacteria bacterium]|nr:PIN domain-containing protein [Candidatus Rokubacteria bacterium]MBI3106305.1 PIN domain-containing protein [Candidatus Rokubacteria bacterium]
MLVTTIDCLIAVLAVAHDAELFTADQDFTRMTPWSGLRLLAIT